jgi:hypothetical protein
MNSDDVKQLGVTHQLSNGELTRVEIDDDHYYFIDGEFCMSVTEVLDKAAPFPEGLRQWLRKTDAAESEEVFKNAGDRGTKLHDALERLLNGIELEMTDYPTKFEKDALVSFVRVMRFLQPTKFKTELILADKELRIGGTTDLVAWADSRKLDILLDATKYLRVTDKGLELKDKFSDLLDGEPEMVKFIWDHKFTGRSTYNHKVQASKYRYMYNKSYSDEETATRSFTWRYSPMHKNRFDFKEADLPESSFNRIYETCIDYLGEFPEPPPMVVYPETLRIFEPLKKLIKETA